MLKIVLMGIFGFILLLSGLAHLLKIICLDDFLVEFPFPRLRKFHSFSAASFFVGLGVIMLSKVFHFHHVMIIRYISFLFILPFIIVSACPCLYVLLHILKIFIDFLLKYLDKLFE